MVLIGEVGIDRQARTNPRSRHTSRADMSIPYRSDSADKIHFQNGVYQIPFADVRQRGPKELPLKRRATAASDV
jgi:hypothetical protein